MLCKRCTYAKVCMHKISVHFPFSDLGAQEVKRILSHIFYADQMGERSTCCSHKYSSVKIVAVATDTVIHQPPSRGCIAAHYPAPGLARHTASYTLYRYLQICENSKRLRSKLSCNGAADDNRFGREADRTIQLFDLAAAHLELYHRRLHTTKDPCNSFHDIHSSRARTPTRYDL